MATSKTTNTYNRLGWEEADFPILCQTCLGDNPYIRMTKEKYGKECKICSRPFTVFRWCPGARMRFKKSEVCQTCSKMKNICQTCLLDLEYGLPTQVRDAALQIKDDAPKSDVNREYYIQNKEKELKLMGEGGGSGKSQGASDLLLKLARTTPYYKRNRPHICSFWVKGECKRGEECPYRHEKPTDPEDPLADQNIKDRYHGVNDPVAEKLLRRAAAMPKLDPPEDKTITTLYVGNLGDKVTEKDLRDEFYQYGEIRSVTMVARQQCAFVQFVHRNSAEQAAERTFNKLIINGHRLNIKWGRSQGKQGLDDKDLEEMENQLEPVPGLPGTLPPPPQELANNYFNLSPHPAQSLMPHLPNIPMGPPGLAPPGIPQHVPPGMQPPPMPRPPSGVRPPGPPPYFFPPHLRPPLRPPPGIVPGIRPPQPPVPGTVPPAVSVSLPPGTIPPAVQVPGALPPAVPVSVGPPRPMVHYPSQDPSRMGTVQKPETTE